MVGCVLVERKVRMPALEMEVVLLSAVLNMKMVQPLLV
jgi:hypothetical protein